MKLKRSLKKMKFDKKKKLAFASSKREFLKFVAEPRERINPVIIEHWELSPIWETTKAFWYDQYKALDLDYKTIPVYKLIPKAKGHGEGFDTRFHDDFIKAIGRMQSE
jgi:hypothetical protein